MKDRHKEESIAASLSTLQFIYNMIKPVRENFFVKTLGKVLSIFFFEPLFFADLYNALQEIIREENKKDYIHYLRRIQFYGLLLLDIILERILLLVAIFAIATMIKPVLIMTATVMAIGCLFSMYLSYGDYKKWCKKEPQKGGDNYAENYAKWQEGQNNRWKKIISDGLLILFALTGIIAIFVQPIIYYALLAAVFVIYASTNAYHLLHDGPSTNLALSRDIAIKDATKITKSSLQKTKEIVTTPVVDQTNTQKKNSQSGRALFTPLTTTISATQDTTPKDIPEKTRK